MRVSSRPSARAIDCARLVFPTPGGPTLQMIGWWTRPTGYLERLRAQYGSRFTLRLLGQPPFVVLSDPDDLRAVFTAEPDISYNLNKVML